MVKGVVRLLQKRARQGKGPLVIGALDAEFRALWRAPFCPSKALPRWKDAVALLRKWPNDVQLFHDGTEYYLQLKPAWCQDEP